MFFCCVEMCKQAALKPEQFLHKPAEGAMHLGNNNSVDHSVGGRALNKTSSIVKSMMCSHTHQLHQLNYLVIPALNECYSTQ